MLLDPPQQNRLDVPLPMMLAILLLLFLRLDLIAAGFGFPQRALVTVRPPSSEDNLKAMLQRLPYAPFEVAKSGGMSFVQTAAVMVPVGMLVNIKALFKTGAKTWFKRGSTMGLDWAVISAVFQGGETFFATLRGKEDRWNVYFGSGLASAVMGAKDGPAGVMQGFFTGFAFMYAVDQFLPQGDVPSVPLSASRGARLQQSQIVGRSGAAAAAVKRYKRF